jgi:hypothetical protein
VIAATKTVKLNASLDPLQVVEGVTEAVVAALAVAGLVFLVVKLVPMPVIQIIPTPDGSGLQLILCWGKCPAD